LILYSLIPKTLFRWQSRWFILFECLMAFKTVLNLLHFSLLGQSLLLFYQIFLFHLRLFVKVVLLDDVLSVRETQSLFFLVPVQDKSFAKLLPNCAKVISIEVVIHFSDRWSLLAASMGLIFDWLWATE
jgi:hypothetical protein